MKGILYAGLGIFCGILFSIGLFVQAQTREEVIPKTATSTLTALQEKDAVIYRINEDKGVYFESLNKCIKKLGVQVF